MKKRLFCLDLLRGLDIFYLLAIHYGLLVGGFFRVWPLSSPGAKAFWLHSTTAFAAGPEHVPSGFGILDFTQPLFIFVTGVSASLAMAKFFTADGFDRVSFWKRLLKRTAMLWLFGSLIRGLLEFKLFMGSPPSFCLYSDTLHTIALAYFSASVGLLLGRRWMRLAVAMLLIAIPAVVMASFGDYTQHGNAARLLEDAVYTRLGGKAKDFCYLLTTFSWAGMGILASLAGDLMKSDVPQWTKARILSACGFCSLAFGWILSFWIPSIRYIYTVSFVFETMGLATLLLCILYVLTDVLNLRRGTWLLILFGQCSLAAWMTVNFFGGALNAAATRFVHGIPVLTGTDRYQPIFTACARVAILVWALWAWRRIRAAKGNR
jgi:predicted acyltransferase